MGQGRRQFTDEFKQEAVALLVSSGRPLSQIASELGISPSMLRNWRNGSGGRDAGSARRPIPAAAPHSAPDPASPRERSPADGARHFKNVWPAPSARGFVRGDLTGLRQRIRSQGSRPGQDGVPRALVLIKATALMRHFLNQAARTPVRPSGHLAVTTRRFQELPTPGGPAASPV